MSTQITRGAFTMLLGVTLSLVLSDYVVGAWRLVVVITCVAIIVLGYAYVIYTLRSARGRRPSAVRDRIREGLDRARERGER